MIFKQSAFIFSLSYFLKMSYKAYWFETLLELHCEIV